MVKTLDAQIATRPKTVEVTLSIFEENGPKGLRTIQASHILHPTYGLLRIVLAIRRNGRVYQILGLAPSRAQVELFDLIGNKTVPFDAPGPDLDLPFIKPISPFAILSFAQFSNSRTIGRLDEQDISIALQIFVQLRIVTGARTYAPVLATAARQLGSNLDAKLAGEILNLAAALDRPRLTPADLTRLNNQFGVLLPAFLRACPRNQSYTYSG